MSDPTPMSLADLLGTEINLAEVTDEDLVSRRDALTDAMETAAAEGGGEEIVALIEAAQAQKAEIVAEQGTRATIAAQLAARIEAALGESRALDAGPEDEETEGDGAEGGDGTETTEGTEGDAGDGEVAEAAAETAEPAPTEVAAAAAPKREINRSVRVPARHKVPATAKRDTGPALKVAGEVRGFTPGQTFQNADEMNRAMFYKWLSLAKSKESGVPHMMATIDYQDQFPAEQRLSGGSPDEVTDKVLAFVNAKREELRGDGGEALNALRIASGGVPGPAQPRYQQITYGSADRPLKDTLPNFLAERGQIIFNGSPTLADVLTDTGAGAIGTVTSAQDAAGATKDIQEISAPTPQTVTVEAETMRWSQGNFADRFYPERTAAFMRLGMVAFARHNEALRLADIKAGCTKFSDTPAVYGAYRDLKRQFLGQTEELEDLVRDFGVPIRCLMPEYVPAMLAADMVAQQPGDRAYLATEEGMRADMESWDPNVSITWLHDSLRGRLSTSPSGQSPRSAGFDADVEWALFPEGAFLFLDGGQLDLGILRDTVSSATNKFQTFYECWEAIAPLVSNTLCFWMTSSLCSDGASQVATSIGKCSPQGS